MNFLRTFFGLGLVVIGAYVMGSSYSTAADVQRFIQEHPQSLILFQRNGCPYCAHVRPLFDAVCEKYASRAGKVEFLAVDVTADAYNFRDIFNFLTVPMFVYIKNGVEQARHGSDNKRLKQGDIEALIEAIYF